MDLNTLQSDRPNFVIHGIELIFRFCCCGLKVYPEVDHTDTRRSRCGATAQRRQEGVLYKVVNAKTYSG